MSWRDLSALMVLSALWGGSFLFMRLAAPALGPVLLIELRVLLAGLALLGFALATRSLPEFRPRWKQSLVIGVINSALPFTLIATAELHLTASLAATLNATTPLFGALVGAWWLREPLTWGKGAGLLLGLAGVTVLVGLGHTLLSPATLLSIGASLLAALSYTNLRTLTFHLGRVPRWNSIAAAGRAKPGQSASSSFFLQAKLGVQEFFWKLLNAK